MPLVGLCLNFIKFEWLMTSLLRHLSFLQTIIHILNFIESTNFVLGTNVQQNKVHLMIQVKVTLAYANTFTKFHHNPTHIYGDIDFRSRTDGQRRGERERERATLNRT